MLYIKYYQCLINNIYFFTIFIYLLLLNISLKSKIIQGSLFILQT